MEFETVVIEDHDILRETIVEALNESGFKATGLSCAEDFDDIERSQHTKLYILDLNLPGEDGLSLAQRIRAAQPDAGIIMTTARTGLSDKLLGYERGADLYLPKPVLLPELAAALKALAARLSGAAQRDRAPRLCTDENSLAWGEFHCKLTSTETKLLSAFATAKDRRLERWQVAYHLNPYAERGISADNLQVRISQLRKKVKAAIKIDGDIIRAVRGVGYELSTPILID